MSRRTRGWSLLAALLLLSVGSVPGAPQVRLVEIERVSIEVRPLTGTAIDLPATGGFLLDVDPQRGGEVAFDVRWPDESSRRRVRVRATPAPGRPGRLEIRAEVSGGPGRSVLSERSLAASDGSTSLFEVSREAGRPLTLALSITVNREATVAGPPSGTSPVQLNLEIQWVEGQQTVSLERNQLNTFVGESVSYSFRFDGPEESQWVRLELTPLRIADNLVRIEVVASGALPDGDTLAVFSRTEQLLCTRGAASGMTVQAGQPPSGYRFLVTPLF